MRRHSNDNSALCRISNTIRMTNDVDLFQPFLISAWGIYTFEALFGFRFPNSKVGSNFTLRKNTFQGGIPFLGKRMKMISKKEIKARISFRFGWIQNRKGGRYSFLKNRWNINDDFSVYTDCTA